MKVTTDMYRYALGWELEKIYPLYISFIHMKSHVVHVYDKSLGDHERCRYDDIYDNLLFIWTDNYDLFVIYGDLQIVMTSS